MGRGDPTRPNGDDHDRRHAAAEVLREAVGWQKLLRERIEGLSWDRIAGRIRRVRYPFGRIRRRRSG